MTEKPGNVKALPPEAVIVHHVGASSLSVDKRAEQWRHTLGNPDRPTFVSVAGDGTICGFVSGGKILWSGLSTSSEVSALYLLDAVKPFVRLDPSRPNPSGSVGLGLSIVEEIVQAHQGTLTLINKQPNGLIARLNFPALNSETSLAVWRGASDNAYWSPGITSAD